MRNIHYINAGAGSGKTYSLTKTLVDLIEGGKCKPSEVILTTFTELAATEFRQKAYDALVKAGAYERAAELDSAAIGTVHSIALRYVQKYWYILGLGSRMNVLSEDDKKVFISENVAKVIDHEDRKVFMKFNETFTRKGYRNDDPWIDLLKKILEDADTFGIDNLEASREHSLSYVSSFFDGQPAVLDKELAQKWLKGYYGVIKEGKKGGEPYADEEAAIEAIERCAARLGSYPSLVDLSGMLTTPKNPSKSKALPGYDVLVEQVAAALKSSALMEPLQECIKTVFDLAIKVQGSFEQYKAENGFIEYNDMEKYFIQLLDNDLVKDDIRSSVKYVFVDEFQDSNPIQIEIFSRLSDLVQKSYWVGDPKQSIYGFRGSAPEVVMDITRQIRAGGNGFSYESLPYSWRSGRKLVDFDSAVAGKLFTDPGRYPNPGLEAAPKGNAFEAEHPVQHWNCLDGVNSATLSQEIIEILSATDLQPKDIAILCKTNDNVSEMADGLRAYGLPVSAPEVFLAKKAETQLLFAILRFMLLHDQHTKAELAMLIQDATLEDIILDKPAVLAAFDDLRLMEIAQRVRYQSVPDIVDTVIDEMDLRGLCSRWGDSINRQANLDTLQSLSREYDAHCIQMGIGSSLNGFITYVGSLDILPKGSNSDNGIKVLTYHAAKGLEWRMVILLDLKKHQIADNILRPHFVYGLYVDTDAEGRSVLRYIPDFRPSERNGVPSFIMEKPHVQAGYEAYVEKCREEAKRLLYVGFTRARDYLVTVSYPSGREKLHWLEACGLSPVSPKEIKTVGSLNIWGPGLPNSYVYELTGTGTARYRAEAETVTWYKPAVSVSERQHRYISPSRSEAAVETVSMPAVHLCPGITTTGSFEPNILGTCIHNFFAVCDSPAMDVTDAARRLIHNFGLDEVIREASQMVDTYAALRRHLLSGYGPAVMIHHELPFNQLRSDGVSVVGEIDLAWELADRHCIVVDYKNELRHSDHSAQLFAYRAALEDAGYTVDAVLIYYPLIGDLVEIRKK